MFSKLKKRYQTRFCKKKKPREIVIIFPFNTKSKEIFVVQEFIHHYNKSYWKYVSGGVDKTDKDLLTHAKEELQEEVGLDSKNLYHFHSMKKIFGNRGTHFFIAEDPQIMEHPPENPDTDIIIDQRWLNYEDFQKMIEDKDLLWDEATMCALQVFRKYR